MKATEFKMRVTHTVTKTSIVIALSDLQAYEGEDNGVFINDATLMSKLPVEEIESWRWLKVSNKSGYHDSKIDWDILDFEYVV